MGVFRFCQAVALLLASFYTLETSSFAAAKMGKMGIRMQTKLLAEAKPSAALSLIRKSKKKLVDKLIGEIEEAGAEHPVTKFLQTQARPDGVGPPKHFQNTTRVTTGTLAIFPEYNRKTKTGFMVGMPPPEIMGGVLRDAGARAIIVSVDTRSGGATPDDVERFCREQTKARIFMPPPISIVWHDQVMDLVQVSHAAAMGAAAIILQADICGQEQLAPFISYSRELGMEPIVLIRSEEEGLAAVEAGARYLCMHTLEEGEMLALKAKLPTHVGGNTELSMDKMSDENADNAIFYSARLRPESDFSTYGEIDICWTLRDHGFSAVWPSPEAVYTQGMGDIYTTIAAMRAKASRVYISPRQFLMDRSNEGAQEYLGDILY
ncbi:hypothetical protein B484DRAFT_449511 [Ochromonadaceae sp. CCMP2298]|nr:hypothetical protein B484DRAFT_449511 [Ochromonadaceae sp. CCMP2298]